MLRAHNLSPFICQCLATAVRVSTLSICTCTLQSSHSTDTFTALLYGCFISNPSSTYLSNCPLIHNGCNYVWQELFGTIYGVCLALTAISVSLVFITLSAVNADPDHKQRSGSDACVRVWLLVVVGADSCVMECIQRTGVKLWIRVLSAGYK